MNHSMITKLTYPLKLDNVIDLGNGAYSTVLGSRDFQNIFGKQLNNWLRMDSIFQRAITSNIEEITLLAKDIAVGNGPSYFKFPLNILNSPQLPISYNENKRELIIKIEAEISLLDNYKLYLALEMAHEINPNLNFKVAILCYTLDIYGLHEYYAQICMERINK